MKFTHISDPHISSRFPAILQHIIRNYPKGTLVVCTGDLTKNGTQKEYITFFDMIAPAKAAGIKFLFVPGNHDYGRLGNTYSKKAHVHFRDLVELRTYPIVEIIDGVRFVALDSCIGNAKSKLEFASGEIGTKQLTTLDVILSGYPDLPTVVPLHHHVFNRGFTMELDDSSDLMRMLRYHKVNLILMGHQHQADIWQDKAGIDWIVASGKTTKDMWYREIEWIPEKQNFMFKIVRV